MRCRTARRCIDEGLERELALEERFQLEGHVARCTDCAAYQSRALRLQELLEGPGDPPPPRLDEDAAARAVFAALDRREQPDRAPADEIGASASPRGRGLRVAAVLMLGAAGVLALLAHNGSGPSAPQEDPPEEDEPWTTASVQEEVRSAVRERFASDRIDQGPALEQFLERTRAMARAGWPVRRFVEDALEDSDADLARAAARGLGALGDPGSVPALERALARTELAETVFEALGAAGEPAVPALERLLARRDLALRALTQLCRIGGAQAALVIERGARAARPDSVPSREALLDALTATGPSAVAGLLRLAGELDRREGGSASAAVLARLPLVASAGPELVRCLEREHPPMELAYRSLLVLQPPEAVPWLLERCQSSRERASALEALARFPGHAPLEATLELALGGRVARADLERLLVGLLERDAGRAEPYSRTLVEGGEGLKLRTWLSLLIESEHPRAAGALVPLVFCAGLSDSDRQWAALAIGELGGPSDASTFVEAFLARPIQDRRLAATCAITVHALLGAEGIERLFWGCTPTSVRRVLDALDSAGRPGDAVRVHRVARALEGALSELKSTPNDKEAL